MANAAMRQHGRLSKLVTCELVWEHCAMFGNTTCRLPMYSNKQSLGGPRKHLRGIIHPITDDTVRMQQRSTSSHMTAIGKEYSPAFKNCDPESNDCGMKIHHSSA